MGEKRYRYLVQLEMLLLKKEEEKSGTVVRKDSLMYSSAI